MKKYFICAHTRSACMCVHQKRKPKSKHNLSTHSIHILSLKAILLIAEDVATPKDPDANTTRTTHTNLHNQPPSPSPPDCPHPYEPPRTNSLPPVPLSTNTNPYEATSTTIPPPSTIPTPTTTLTPTPHQPPQQPPQRSPSPNPPLPELSSPSVAAEALSVLQPRQLPRRLATPGQPPPPPRNTIMDIPIVS